MACELPCCLTLPTCANRNPKKPDMNTLLASKSEMPRPGKTAAMVITAPGPSASLWVRMRMMVQGHQFPVQSFAHAVQPMGVAAGNGVVDAALPHLAASVRCLSCCHAATAVCAAAASCVRGPAAGALECADAAHAVRLLLRKLAPLTEGSKGLQRGLGVARRPSRATIEHAMGARNTRLDTRATGDAIGALPELRDPNRGTWHTRRLASHTQSDGACPCSRANKTLQRSWGCCHVHVV